MADRTHIKALGEYDYLIRVLAGEDMIEIRVHASPDVIARLPADTDENRLIQATAAYLIRRSGPTTCPRVSISMMCGGLSRLHRRDGRPALHRGG